MFKLMFDNFSKSIFIRIICSVFAALLIGVVCIFTGSHIIEKESAKKLKYLTENNAYKIEIPLEIIEKTSANLSYIISHMVYTKKIQGDSPYSVDYVEELDAIIKKFSTGHSNLIGIYVYLTPEYSFDKKQNTYFYAKSSLTDTIKKQKIEKEKEAPLKKFKKDVEEMWGEPYIDKLSGLYAISFEKPIILNKKVIGFTRINISLRDIMKILSNIKIYNNGQSFLFDNCYCVIFGPKNIQQNNKLLLKLLTEKLKTEDSGIINFKQNNVEMVSGFLKLKTGFTYVITAPKDDVFEQKYHLQQLITGIIFMGTLLVVLIMLNI
ncbi:MAG TPA: hypothetical protein DDW90_04265 [Cyanobacteria bacterium UBA9971]|nr:hypothetical protein [Cyanobacteria bacterium UBA9971]